MNVPHEEDADGTVRATVGCPAKLNLMLAVGRRRADGYHDVASIMQTLDLSDRMDLDVDVTVDTSVRDVLVEADGVPGGDTLVTRAVHELLERAGRGARVWVTIEKEIPIGGGLGGGSSNAASALVAVNSMLGSPLSYADLAAIGAGIGTDIPFFLLGPGSAGFATGRGDLIRAVHAPAPRPWLIAFPRTSQSTADVYVRHDPGGVPVLPATVAEAMRLARSRIPRNDLTTPAREACPPLDRLCTAIGDAGGIPLVCGSGASVAVRVTSNEERRAFEAVCSAAVPGCWLRLTRTTRAASR